MGEERARYRRPLKFFPGVEKAVRTLPADVQDIFGKALMDAQHGDQSRITQRTRPRIWRRQRRRRMKQPRRRRLPRCGARRCRSAASRTE